ncbi:hypothetical protein PALB_19680 [Pseudoalteromonas luteoviolacea B = ATCC 29581]|nr:hypothetical protein PALB_19680 [Pseudoalteromonas luteoviolacea B = ATCC 29581]
MPALQKDPFDDCLGHYDVWLILLELFKLSHEPKHNSVQLRANANRFAIEFMIVGGVALVVVMLFVLLRPTSISVVEIFIVSAGLVSLLIGFLKSQEPFYSLTFNVDALLYHHKVGTLTLERLQLVEAGVPNVQAGQFSLELNAVGIKIKDVEAFLNSLAPRLAAKLLIEQRHIFLQAVKMHCENGNCPEEWLIEDTHYIGPQGRKYTGLLAMFGNRMAHFKLATGYDLMMTETVLDRDIWRFANLLNHWRRDPERVLEQLKQQAQMK